MENIAVYLGTLPEEKAQWEIADRFKFEVAHRFISRYKDGAVYLLSDTPVEKHFPDNSELLTIGKYAPNKWSMYRHFNHRLPAAIKEANSDHLLALAGILPLKYKKASYLLVPDGVSTIENPARKERMVRYLKRYLPHFLENASAVFTFSAFTKQYLIAQYEIPEHRVQVVKRGIFEIFKPQEWEEREEVKEQYADGREFLLFLGDISKENKVLTLLKAFTVLKKKMNSSMVLILAGKQDSRYKKFPELLRTYHFRKDVRWIKESSQTEAAKLVGAAYARVISSGRVAFCSTVPETLQCRTPIVVPEGSIQEELGGGAVLTFKPGNYEHLGDQLCELYKKEDLRSKLMAHAKESIAGFSWNDTIGQFLNALTGDVEKNKK